VVFFDLRALTDTPELDERVPRVRFVLSSHDFVVIGGRHETNLYHLRIRKKVERYQVGTRLLERGILFFQHRRGIAVEVLGDFAGCVTDDLVHVREQFTRDGAPLRRAVGLFRRPRELASKSRQR
jgi:hypothetical protein